MTTNCIKSLCYLLLLFLFFTACNHKISKEDLKVIDKIELGMPISSFHKQLDSLKTSKEAFFTSVFITDYNAIYNKENSIIAYYTNTFNFDDFKNKHFEHLGLLYPEYRGGAKNIVALTILLGHTAKPFFFGDAAAYEYKEANRAFNQNINEDIINKIVSLYTDKYGQPSVDNEGLNHRFLAVEGNTVNSYERNSNRTGVKLTWQSNYYTITLFKGLESYDSEYNRKEKWYTDMSTVSFSGQENREPLVADPMKGQVKCYTFPYIKYQLKESVIKSLKLEDYTL